MTDTESDFSAFEAAANSGEPVVPEPKADEPLDLTANDEAVEAAEGDEGGEEDADSEGRKRRSRPAHLRIAQEVAKRHEIQRELDALRAKYEAPATVSDKPRPDPAQFEYGEADPAYLEALTDWKLDAREAERAKANAAHSTRQQFVDKINTGVTSAETTGKAKYPDFEAKVSAAVEARGGDPLPPILTVGIGISPVGGDLIYRLATDEKVASRLETLARGGQPAANATAMALGELEGEYLPDDDDADLDVADPLDMARMLGRLRSRMKGVKAPAKITTTSAPEPPAQRARGGSGQFQVSADTSDFAAFEKLANAKR